MSIRSKRNLGDIDAQKDENFENHFIEVHKLHKIIDNDSDIVYGLKGSGKTALCRALTELNVNKYLTAKLINLDSISFSQIHAALKSLNETTNKEVVGLSSHTWHNVLLIYGIEAYANILPNNSDLKKRIEDFVINKKYTNSKSNNRLITFIQNFIIKIKEIGYHDINEESPLGLTRNQFEEIDKTFDDELHSLILTCNKALENEPKKILVCLDGLDSVLEHTEESRKTIFSGLVDAIYKCSKDNIISKNFCFKAFLPREITDEIRNTNFDTDKFAFNIHHLKWSISEFEELIQKRLSIHSKTKSKIFKDVWAEHLPEKVFNVVHGAEENTLEYILRHTLYRPRHLLLQMQFIFDEWDFKYSSQKVDPSFIPKIICKTNTVLSEMIASELEYTIPGITQFLHSWHSISCTISAAQFKDRMKRMFNITKREEERNLFDRLYNIGIIGFLKAADLKNKKSNSIGCSFAYANNQLGNRMVFNIIDEDDIIALSPIFQEYCGCSYSNYGYIYQK